MQAYRDVTEKSFSFFNHNAKQLKIKVFLANFNSINSIGFEVQLHKQSVNDKVQRTQVGYLLRAHAHLKAVNYTLVTGQQQLNKMQKKYNKETSANK